jgi:hypothetical protein
MQTILWAFGSMAVLMLIILILPIGLSLKGKIIVVSVSFVLALAGIAATTSFPIWIIFILLLALALFTSYFMDKRIGALLYMNEKQNFSHEIDEFDSSTKNKSGLELDLLEDISSVELTASSTFLTDKNIYSQSSLPEIQPVIGEKTDIHREDEEDLSFLDVPNKNAVLEVTSISEDELIDSENHWLQDLEELSVEELVETQLVETELETGYLSDIENLLEESSEETLEIEEKGWLDELAELSVTEDKDTKDTEEPTLDDSELEELFAEKEVAPTREKDKTSKQLELQK